MNRNTTCTFNAGMKASAGLVLLACIAASGCSDSGSPNKYALGGEISGLASNATVTLSAVEQELTVSENGSFEFPDRIRNGSDYEVTVSTFPGGQGCEVSNGSGTFAGSDVSNVQVTCFDEPSLSATSGIMHMTLSWSGPDNADVKYSSDPDCDWDNYSVCADSGMMTGVSGPDLELEAVADGFDPKTPWYFVVERAGFRSNVSVARPAPLQIERGTVTTMARHQDTLYLGGDFESIAMAAGLGGTVSAETALPVGSLPEIRGEVYDVVSDGNGGWFICGYFDAVDGESRSHLAHILPDGSLDTTWQATVDASGYAWNLVRDGNELFVTGLFTTANGETRSNVAAFSTTGNGELLDFQTGDFDDDVLTIAPTGDTVYVGGSFTTVDGMTRERLAAFDRDTGDLDTGFAPSANAAVDSIALTGNGLYVGGRFDQLNGQPRRLALVDPADGSLDTSFAPDLNDRASQLFVHDGTLYVGGNFTASGVSARERFAAFSLADNSLSDWAPTFDGTTWAMAVHNDRFYVGGGFESVNGEDRLRLAAFDLDNGELLDWAPSASNFVYGIAQSDETVYLAGAVPGGLVREGLAAVDINSGRLLDWAPVTDDEVLSLTVHSDQLYAGGDFLSINGENRTRLARFDTNSGELEDWNPEADDSVEALHAANDMLYVGGEFTTVNSTARARLAAFDLSTDTLDADIDLDINFDVNSLLPYGDWLYIGGNFTEINGTSQRLLAAVSRLDGSVDFAWDPGVTAGRIHALAVADNRLYAGGDIDSVNLAAYDLSDASRPAVSGWQPETEDTVRTIQATADTVYIGGAFDMVNNNDQEHVAALSTQDGTRVSGWNTEADWRVSSSYLDADEGRLYLGGDFRNMRDLRRESFVVLDADNGDIIW